MSRNKWLRISAASIIVAFVASRSFAVPQETLSCTSPEYRQVEFWIGDWDVYERESATRGAHVRVDRILDGCVLREHYDDNTGAVGESFTIYDVARKLWHQTWVTNRGRLLTIEGGPEDHSSMVLAGAYYRDNSEEVRVRGTWQPVSGGVRESADTSVDAGKTWKPWFDLEFRPHKSADKGANTDDATTVANLDEQFRSLECS